jgi:hypothetical protein
MGWPLAALAALVTYLAIRAAQRAVPRPATGSKEPEADPARSAD